jgi:hypothetical protein
MKVRDSDILAWVWGQKKMSQVLGMFGLLDFTILGCVETYKLFISLIFQFFSGHGKPQILNQQIWGQDCTYDVHPVLLSASS